MKKMIFGVVFAFIMACSDVVLAQENYPVFSSSLGGGSYVGTRRNMYTPRGNSGQGAKKQSCKKTVIKYPPNVGKLPDSEKERYIAPIVQRIQRGEVKSIKITAYSSDHMTATKRVSFLQDTFSQFDISVKGKRITGMAVVKSNEDLVEIMECR